MANMTPSNPSTAMTTTDRTTVPVKAVPVEIGEIL